MASFKLKALVALSDVESIAMVNTVLSNRGISDIFYAMCTHDAIDAMVETRFDLFIVDARVPVTLKRAVILHGGIDYIRFIRMCEGAISEATVVFLRSQTNVQNLLEAHAEIVSAKDAGASCVLAQPFTEKKFDSEVVPLVIKPRSFIRSLHYTGPCRRRRSTNVKVERRL